MPIQQDLILRMLEQLSAAFGRIFAGRPLDDIDDPAQAILEIEQVLAGILHVRPETLDFQPLELLDRVDPAVAAELSKLLVARARLAMRTGQPHLAYASLTRAIDGLLRAPGHRFGDDAMRAVDTLRHTLRDETLASLLDLTELATAWASVFDYEAEHARYADAEDALFAALELVEDELLRTRGIRFYESLIELDDAAIERGGLSREEVLTALTELRESP
jgi:hypothetical protein